MTILYYLFLPAVAFGSNQIRTLHFPEWGLWIPQHISWHPRLYSLGYLIEIDVTKASYVHKKILVIRGAENYSFSCW